MEKKISENEVRLAAIECLLHWEVMKRLSNLTKQERQQEYQRLKHRLSLCVQDHPEKLHQDISIYVENFWNDLLEVMEAMDSDTS